MVETMRDAFERDGYWVSPILFGPSDLDEIREHFDAVLRGEYQLVVKPHGVDRFYVDDRLHPVMVKVSNAWWADAIIRAVVLDRRIARIAHHLLGVPELYLWADSLYWKAPLAASEQAVVGWHQDKAYWGVSSTDQMITACVALYEADALSGGMRFARGSHRWGLVGGSDFLTGRGNAEPHRRPQAPDGERWDEETPRLRPGQVTFHHALTFHGSGPNLSAEPRRSITIHMVSGEGRLVNWKPDAADVIFSTVGLGNSFGVSPIFPRLYP